MDILRLLSLYALRYERHASNELNTLKYEAQKQRKFPEKYIQVRLNFDIESDFHRFYFVVPSSDT